MKFNSLEAECKWYEKNFSPEQMIPLLPVIIRLDGNGFSKWSQKLQKPFDVGFNRCFDAITKDLVNETGAVIGYTQSDEITLILYSDDISKEIYHDGKKQKILSKLTGWMVTRFNDYVEEFISKDMPIANFDCRIYQVPTLEVATRQLLWREGDAVRNSKQGLGFYTFGHSAINNMSTAKIQDKLMEERGINWNDLPVRNKRGVYFRRILKKTAFTPEEIETLPKQHAYFKNPNLIIERKVIEQIEMPILSKIGNLVDVVFNGAEPLKWEK